jgi:hypothetical protein
MALFSVRAQGPLEHILRAVGLLLVISLTVWGFWANSQRQTARLVSLQNLADVDKRLNEDERAQVQALITELRTRYGLELRVHITRTAPTPPKELDAKTIFVGISPETGQSMVLLPPLVQNALGADFATRLTTEHFPFHLAPDKNWQKGLILALELIRTRLATLQTGPATTQPATPSAAANTPNGATAEKERTTP